MRLKKRILFGAALAGMLLAYPVCAASQETELPVITAWQDGHGYQEDGTQIADGWAYDSVNPAGKYVLFGEDGTVLRKTENMEETDLSEEYTGTELVPAVLALRAEVFEGFHGTIHVLLEEKSGIQKAVELNAENFYSLNVCMNSGDYVFREIKAWEEDAVYATEFSTASVYLPQEGLRVMKLTVKEERVEAARELPAETEGQEETEEMEKEQQTEVNTGKEGGMMQKLDRKKIAALSGGIGVILAGIWAFCRKRKKYS